MITDNGVTLELSRIPRWRIDEFFSENPPPEIPTREVTVFGGVVEEVENEDDPDYQRELLGYRLRVLHRQVELISPYVEIKHDWRNDEKLVELAELGVCKPESKEDYMRFIALSRESLFDLIDELLYLSTTTERGVQEAAIMFNVTWNDQPVLLQNVSNNSPGKFSRMFEDREAARFANIAWKDFIELTGQEQSAILAHFRIRMRLNVLDDKERAMKMKGKRK